MCLTSNCMYGIIYAFLNAVSVGVIVIYCVIVDIVGMYVIVGIHT